MKKSEEHAILSRIRWRTARRRACLLREQANVAHVLDAVGAKFTPKWINLRRLRADLDFARTAYRVQFDLDSKRMWKERSERLTDIAETSKILRVLFEDETGGWVYSRLSSRFPQGEGQQRPRGGRELSPSLSGLKAGLRRLERAASRELSTGQVSRSPPISLRRTPAEWFFVEHLPPIFERWFRREAGVSRSHNPYTEETGKADGPYVRFAASVMKEVGVTNQRGEHYSVETIAREWGRAQSGQVRRQARAARRPNLPK
jgi:hypothetical protein